MRSAENCKMITDELFDFSLLPPHIIAQTLNYLDIQNLLTASRICKSWYYAACDPLITRQIHFRIYKNPLNGGAGFSLYKTHFKYINFSSKMSHLDEWNLPFGSIRFSYVNFNNFDFIKLLQKFGHNITEVSFDNCTLTLNQLLQCLVSMTNLSAFQINAKPITFTNIRFTRKCNTKMIVEKNLYHVKNFKVFLESPDAGGLAFLMRMMPNLKNLSFGTGNYSKDCIYRVFFDYINMRADVNLDQLKIGDEYSSMPNKFMEVFAQTTAKMNIKTLSLTSIYDFNGFENICRQLKNLRKLSILNSKIEKHQLISICLNMTRLTWLELSDVITLQVDILSTLQDLEVLKLRFALIVLERSDHEKRLTESFFQFQNLKTLEIFSCVTDNILKAICHNCRNLTTLQLNNVQAHCCIQGVFQYLRHLKNFTLIRRYQVRHGNIDYDITNLQLLETLEIYDFEPGITLELIKRLPKLKEFKNHTKLEVSNRPIQMRNTLIEKLLYVENEI